MDSDEEFLHLSESENQPTIVPERKLKRLRKANDLPSPPSDDVPSAFEINSLGGEETDRGDLNTEHFEGLSPRSGSQMEVIEQGFEIGSGFENEGKSSGAQRHLDFDSLDEEIDGKGEDRFVTEVEEESGHAKMNRGSDKERGISDDFNGNGKEISGSEMEGSEELRTNGGSEKKRRNLDGFEEKGEKKRKKKVKEPNDGFDGNLFSAASTKKERRERFKGLRAESQRLLRETRDASFRPVPLVQKSVSSVLEKIRQRKHELSKKLVNMTEESYSDGNRAVDLDLLVEEKEAHKDTEEIGEELTSIPVVVEASVEARGEQEAKETSNASDENVTSKMAIDDDFKQTFRAPCEDTQDIVFDSPESDSKDEIPSSPLEEVLAPPLAEMNLKLDSAPPDDISDDEEDSKKNNPLWHGDITSSCNGDPVKAFLDDEAEEEDDSDGDHARFKDDDEDEDNMDSEELNDMIATADEEKPMDNEMRNELHQKWLEQQDAVGTENLLQRLKCPSKQREMAFVGEIEEEEEEESEQGSKDESDNDPTEGLFPRNVVRMSLKKAKEMIPLMFTDKDDVYVSSDDEETEKTHVKRHFSHKTEEKPTFLSPAEDESSKGIFGLIKKLNDAPDVRKKGRISSNFNTSSLGGNKTLSSKSSFLSRGSRNSLPSFQKHSSSTVRSFVFERDDSNSRSAILTAVESSETVETENKPKKVATAKFSYSQVRSSSQTTESKAEKDPGPSLHEILRCPSIKSSDCNGGSGSMAGQFNAIFAAFKLNPYPIKKEAGLSFRTA